MTLTPPTITPEQIYNEHGQFSFVNLNSPEHYTAFAQAILALNNAAWLEMLAGQEANAYRVSIAAEPELGDWLSEDDPSENEDGWIVRKLYTAPVLAQAPAVAVPDVDTLTDIVAGILSGTYHCHRVWSAWGVGTMSENDFSRVEESCTPREVAEAVLYAITAAQAGEGGV